MKNCIYKEVIVIGCGTIAATVMEFVIKSRELYNYNCEFIRYEDGMPSPIKRKCQEANAGYLELYDKKDLEHYLVSIDYKTLILSAGNYYLFPKTVIDNSFLTVINFHNALLPKYPGINAPSWCIFYGEQETGITWHYVTNEIDSGDIIQQKRCPIESDIKAYELVAKLMDLAQSGLEDFFDKLLLGTNSRYKQIGSRGRMCYSKSIPGEGFFNPSDNPSYIYRLLRAIDLGKTHIFPAARFIYGGKLCEVIKYKKVVCNDLKSGPDWLSITLDDEYCLQIKFKEINGG